MIVQRGVSKLPSLEDQASDDLIDALFKKMTETYKTYMFTPEECAELILLDPNATKQICDIEALPPDKLTYGKLKEYYDIHGRLWRRFKAKKNSLVKRLATLKEGA